MKKMLIHFDFILQSVRDITNFKGPSKMFVISKVHYIEMHYIKSINQQNSFKRDIKENLDFYNYIPTYILDYYYILD